MNYRELLSELARQLNLDSLEPDGDGCCLLRFDDGLEVELQQLDSSHVLLRSSLDEPPEADFEAEEFFQTLLQRNLPRVHEQREVLTLDPDTDRVMLYRVERIGSLAAFVTVLEEFLNSVETWSKSDEAKSPLVANAFPMNAILP